MEFCSSCKSIMVPKNTKKKIVLVCRKCGKKLTKFSPEKYKIKEKNRLKHGDILIVEDDKKKDSEEQRKYIADLYGTESYEMSED